MEGHGTPIPQPRRVVQVENMTATRPVLHGISFTLRLGG